MQSYSSCRNIPKILLQEDGKESIFGSILLDTVVLPEKPDLLQRRTASGAPR